MEREMTKLSNFSDVMTAPVEVVPLVLDVTAMGVSAVNHILHRKLAAKTIVGLEHPGGAHNIAVGMDSDAQVHIHGHVGYYVGGMNKRASIYVHGNAERGAGENMMSGTIFITGNASESAGASAHGGMLVIHGNAAGRCGISLKGGDIVVGGNIGHAAMFMAQAGRLLVCGDAGPGLGDSLYEAVIYVAGNIEGLGADAREEPMTDADRAAVVDMLSSAKLEDGAPDAKKFKRIGSSRSLYHWNSANHSSY
jgi:methylamine---glutamate N-methyltransferase subunit B